MNNSELINSFTDIYFKTMKGMTTLLQTATTDFQVSFEQYQIMRDIAQNKATNLTELVAQRGVTKPAIARQLRALRSLGYLTQDIATDDRRKHILHLTDQGANVETQIEQALQASLSRLVEQIGRDNLHELIRILERLDERVLTVSR